MKKIMMFAAVFMAMVVLSAGAQAAMMVGGPGTGGMMVGGLGGSMMGNSGGFGMMSGMAGAPVVGDDGTAYIVTHSPTTTPGTVPSSNSFESAISAVTPSGQITTLTLKGIISRPVVSGGYLVATASIPDLTNFNVVGNFGNGPASMESVIYAVPLPFTPTTVPPVAISLDGNYASAPVVSNNRIYVVTSDFGGAMMAGNTAFTGMFGSYNFNQSGTAKTYLYLINFDGTYSKITLQ